MKINYYSIFLFLIFFSIQILIAGNPQQYYYTGNFELENGEIIVDCKIGYRTYGILNENKSNVILYPTWFGGTSEHVGNLIRPDKLIDSTGFFIIVVDAFGNGVSSSPSNYSENDFPKVTIKDMVNAQYQLLTQHLKINHLYGAIGGSMGSMQVFEWLVSHPDFIDKAIPYVCSPRPTSQDLLLMHVKKEILEIGQQYNIPEQEILKTYDLLNVYTAHSPDYRVRNTSYEQFPDFLAGFENTPLSKFTAADRLCQLHALMNFDISENFDNSLQKAAESLKATVLMIVSSTDHILNPQPAMEFAKMINAKIMILENDCGHLAIGCEIERCSKAINSFFRNGTNNY
jgi:homoserine O-acetyltransferase